MRKRTGFTPASLISEESGQALILVLLFLLLGSLMLVPALDHIGTALKTGVRYEEKTDELYAADAGIEDGIWQIKYDGLQPKFGGDENYNYDFTANATYLLENPVNGLATNVTINNIWIPSNITLGDLGLSADQAMTMIESEKLIVSGTSGATPGEPYHVMIQFTPDTGDNLTIKSVGVWLPQGFTYVEESCDLDDPDNMFEDYYTTSVSDLPHCGGRAIVWSYNSPYPLFTSFPNPSSENVTLTSTIEFSYNAPGSDPNKMPAGIAWVTAEMADAMGNPVPNPNSPENVPLSWDVDKRIYKITSEAGGTLIEAYSSKLELRDLNDAIAGDYTAIGNSLMVDTGSDHIKDYLYSSSYTTLTENPDDADVIVAYLYWSGFRHYNTLFSDGCSDFDDWDRSSEDGNQTRVPTADGDTNGTWDTPPCWDDVDETTANISDYMTGVTDSGGYQLFSFTPFSLPDLPVTDLTIYISAKDESNGNNNIRPSLKVNGTLFSNVFSGNNPGSSFYTYSYSYTTNPDTGAVWTAADLNGTGDHPLQQFGVYSDDLNPNIQISMVYAKVNYTSDSRWTIYNNWFQGQGSGSATTAQRTLTLKDGFDLSSYTPGTIAVSWRQDESGSLGSGDTLYFAFSSDNGSTWSNNIEAFSDDNPDYDFYYVIPDEYTTANFKMRFYFNFDSSDKYVYLDNIKFLELPPDTSVNFSIDDEQVYLDGDGNPQSGAQPLTATNTDVLLNEDWGGFSYACSRDVSKLVQKYPVDPDEEHHTGNAKYTVGDVQADTGEHVSYAGWSLIIIYFSPETAGHYLYLYDVFSLNPQYTNMDFDYDGEPGGEITDFLIPEPIRDSNGNITETVAAKLTCFIGEGDDWLYGSVPNTDCVQITGQQSGNSMYLSNSASPVNNVWNSASPGMSYDGVDIDTFEVLWSDNILTPNDTKLHLDMYSGQDFWNLVYFILSVRSKTVIGGTEHYTIND